MGRPWTAVVAHAEQRLGRPLPAGFAERYHEELFAAFARELRAIDGVREALAAIALPRCVASSGTHERIRAALTAAGLLDAFDGAIFSATDVERGKPAPDLFLHAAAQMGAAPERCVVVEDSPAGVQAARAAGMTVLGYAGLAGAAPLEAAGARMFTRMAELPALLTGSAPIRAAGQ
jgi:HAD superfamily hydrolase (TIGR01509 family)